MKRSDSVFRRAGRALLARVRGCRKAGVLVRHVLSHTCGVIYCDHAPPGSWFDSNAHVRALEQQAPAWEPGTSGAYNSIDIGFILGEIDGVRILSAATVARESQLVWDDDWPQVSVSVRGTHIAGEAVPRNTVA